MRIKILAGSVIIPELYKIYSKQIFSQGEELLIDDAFLFENLGLIERIKYFKKIRAIKSVDYYTEQFDKPKVQNTNNNLNDETYKAIISGQKETINKLEEYLEKNNQMLSELVNIVNQVKKQEKVIIHESNTSDLIKPLVEEFKDAIKNMPAPVVNVTGGGSVSNGNHRSSEDEPLFIPGEKKGLVIEQGENAAMDIKSSTSNVDMSNIKNRLKKMRGETIEEN